MSERNIGIEDKGINDLKCLKKIIIIFQQEKYLHIK